MNILLARELRDAVRSRWFAGVTGVFCVLALGVSYLGFSGADALGFAGFSRTVAGLLNLMLLFVPLLGLLVGALGLAGEREDGTLGYLLAQPVGRGAVFVSKLGGQGISLALSISLGLGLAGFIVGWETGTSGAAAFLTLALTAVLLGLASLAGGTLVGVAAASRMRALVTVLMIWVLFAFVLDAASLGLVVGGLLGPSALFWTALLNPLQAAKVFCLLTLSTKLEVLGPSGIYAVKAFGTAGAAALLGGVLLAWTGGMALAGWGIFRRMNVR